MNIRIWRFNIGAIAVSMVVMAVVLTCGVAYAAFESSDTVGGFWMNLLEWEGKALAIVLIYVVISHFLMSAIDQFRRSA